MLKADDILPDTYRAGQYLRQWDIVDGQPCCVLDALDMALASPEAVAAAQAKNRVVAERLAAVEAFENAVLLTARPSPKQWVTAYGAGGVSTQVECPAWADYQAALATVAEATDLTRAYVLIRAGRPEAPSAGADPSPDWVAYQAAVAIIAAAG